MAWGISEMAYYSICLKILSSLQFRKNIRSSSSCVAVSLSNTRLGQFLSLNCMVNYWLLLIFSEGIATTSGRLHLFSHLLYSSPNFVIFLLLFSIFISTRFRKRNTSICNTIEMTYAKNSSKVVQNTHSTCFVRYKKFQPWQNTALVINITVLKIPGE